MSNQEQPIQKQLPILGQIITGAIVLAMMIGMGTCFYDVVTEETPETEDEIALEKILQRYPMFPHNEGRTGWVEGVSLHLRNTLNDPGSYEPDGWGEVLHKEDGTFYVRHTFRAKNGFGASVLNDWWFIQDSSGTVLKVNRGDGFN